jgi:hypothetical protein
MDNAVRISFMTDKVLAGAAACSTFYSTLYSTFLGGLPFADGAS